MTFDLAIVGAGPAGSSCAITAAKLGLNVALIDKASFPRDKCCGDGLTASALRHVNRLGVDVRELEGYCGITRTLMSSPSGRVAEIPVEPSLAAVVPRVHFDAALVDAARERGVTVLEATELKEADANSEDVTLRTSGEPVRARYAVGADGIWSPLRRALGLETRSYLGEWHAFRQYVEDVAQPRDELWVWFEKDLLPGYAWSFPSSQGAANVGFGIHRGPRTSGKQLQEIWSSLMDRPAIREVLGDKAARLQRHKAWPIPVTNDPALLSDAGGRVLFAGDAARLADPMTGEGIGQALESGVAAAESVARYSGDPQRCAKEYHSRLRGMRLDNRLAARLSSVLSTPLGARAAIKGASLTPATAKLFGKWLFEDYPRAQPVTPWRWRSHV